MMTSLAGVSAVFCSARRATCFAGVLSLLCGVSSAAQEPTAVSGLGTITFPISCAVPEARHAFVRGVLLLHLFEYADAAHAFREAERLESGCAMAYWGEALTHTHPVWNEQDVDAGRQALEKLAPTPDARAAKAATARELAYLTAAETLYGPGAKAQRDSLYAGAMERLVHAYPNDDEARLFYALSLLGLNQGIRDQRTYAQAAAIAESVFARNPHEPGAAHYLIHAVDDPQHAAQGLAAAEALARVAPVADHAQHMTSHIFVALGMWDDVVRANEAATRIVNAALERGNRSPVSCRHYNVWLDYGYVEQGRLVDAARLLERCRGQATGEGASSESAARDVQSFFTMWANYLLATDDWTGTVVQWHLDPGPTLGARLTYWFTRAFGAIRQGDLAQGHAALTKFTEAEQETEAWAAGSDDPAAGAQELPRARALRAELEGTLAAREGRRDEAIARLIEAAAIEDTMAYAFGPPFVNEPSHELLGGELLRLARFAEASEQFRLALERAPRRTTALLGLAQAAAALRDTAVAVRAYGELVHIWRNADPTLRAAAQAKDYLRRRRAGQ